MSVRHSGVTGILFGLLLAGCASGERLLMEEPAPVRAVQVPTASCEKPSDAQCFFRNSPVKLDTKPIRLSYNPYPFFRTRDRLEFVDARGQAWIAPAGILTDGASIPPLFVPIIGDPRSKEFMNAATVHDSYSAESNRNSPYYHAAPWQDVHRMLYDALRVSGTPAVKAKIMYAAVYLGGPRWKEVRAAPRKQAMAAPQVEITPTAGASQMQMRDGLVIQPAAAGARDMQANTPLPQLYPKAQLIEAFHRAAAYIRANNPSIAEVEIFLTRLELGLASTRHMRKGRKQNFGPHIYLPGEERGGNEGGSDDAGAGTSGGGGASGAGGGDTGGGNAE